MIRPVGKRVETFTESPLTSPAAPKAGRPFDKLRAGFGTAGKVPALPFCSRHHGPDHGDRIDAENESIDPANDDALSGRDFNGRDGVPKFSVNEDLSRR